jgi:glucose dehydrogenase
MTIAIYVIAALFIVLCVALIFGYRRTQHAGLLLMSIVYGSSALLALWNVHWWPLAAGFALVWAMRLLGMEPPVPQMPRDEGGGRNAQG